MGPRNLLACGAWKESSSTQQTWSPGHSCKSITQDLENGSFSPCSVTQLCPALYDPWTAARQASLYTISQSLFKLMSIESVMPSNHLILCHPFLLLPSVFPSIKVFSNESVLHISGQSIGVSASASVIPMNIQNWSPLTGWIFLQSKGLSRVFSNTIQKHQFFSTQLSLVQLSHPHDYWKNHSFD